MRLFLELSRQQIPYDKAPIVRGFVISGDTCWLSRQTSEQSKAAVF
jgi:hypothetical protein